MGFNNTRVGWKMKKSFLTKILTIALSAGLIFHPVIVYADEPVIRLWQ